MFQNWNISIKNDNNQTIVLNKDFTKTDNKTNIDYNPLQYITDNFRDLLYNIKLNKLKKVKFYFLKKIQ